MGTLTPTFKDLTQGAGGTPLPAINISPRSDGGGMHIVAAHEPLASETPILPEENKQETPPQVAPVAAPQGKKIALVGTAPSSRMITPFHDPSWTIWACSPGNMNVLPRVDVWFELHQNLHWPENAHYGKPYVEWLSRLTVPVYMQDQTYFPHAKTFPKDEMVKEFGKDFFTSSFAWMMALAIKEGASEIALFGIDMASRDEYILQRPGFYFFKHVAETRGIKVWAPNESDIMQHPGLYGFSEVKPFGRKILARKLELKQRIADMSAQRDKLNHDITYLQGAIEDLDYVETIWIGQGS